MASMNCISNCVDDDVGRPTYVNRYKWPESDVEFVRWVGPMAKGISCRQMYLKSYTLSRRESVPEITRKCLTKVKQSVRITNGITETRNIITKGKALLADLISTKCLALRKAKRASYAAISSLFSRLLSCAGC